MSLQEKLDAFKDAFQKRQPPEVVETMRRATADLIASGQAGRALKAGDAAPAFALPDQDGRLVDLQELLAKGTLVLTFYRGTWCPYCNTDLQALQAELPAMEAAGGTMAAISPQTAANSRKALRDNQLTFPILTDKGNEVAAAFGLLPAAGRPDRDLQGIRQRPGGCQWRAVLDLADARPLRDRGRRAHHPRGGQSGLHAAAGPLDLAAGAAESHAGARVRRQWTWLRQGCPPEAGSRKAGASAPPVRSRRAGGGRRHGPHRRDIHAPAGSQWSPACGRSNRTCRHGFHDGRRCPGFATRCLRARRFRRPQERETIEPRDSH